MNSIARKQAVLKELQETGSANIIELAEKLNVSTMTIRRDLAKFAEEGIVTLEHGGAILNGGSLFEYGMSVKQSEYVEEKQRIAKQCLTYIKDGQSVYLDSGTTPEEIAKLLVNRRHITVMTHSLLAANALAASNQVNLIMCPGVYRERSMAFMGQMTDDFIARFHIDILFLSVEGVDSEYGVSVQNTVDGYTKKMLIEHSEQIICAADSSKFEKRLFCRIAEPGRIDRYVTDSGIDETIRDQFREKELDLEII